MKGTVRLVLRLPRNPSPPPLLHSLVLSAAIVDSRLVLIGFLVSLIRDVGRFKGAEEMITVSQSHAGPRTNAAHFAHQSSVIIDPAQELGVHSWPSPPVDSFIAPDGGGSAGPGAR
jgi:hypothetical protein